MAIGTTTRQGRRRSTRPHGKEAANPLPGRILGVFLIVAAGYCLLAARLAYLQVVRHEEFVEMAEALRDRSRTIPARRGDLLDRNGTLLVRNEPAADIVLDPNLWQVRSSRTSPTDTPLARRAAALSGLRALLPDVDMAEVERKLERASLDGRLRAVDVARRVDAATAKRIREANLPGVGVLSAYRRVAINGDLAPHIVGYTDIDGTGLEGLEKALDDTLAGEPGILEAEFDPRGRTIPGTVKKDVAPIDGHDVVLTIDAGLQHDVQVALGKAFHKYQAEAATAVVLDPRTGDILALANYPTYNVNHRGKYEAGSRANRAVTAPFEPGSTLKVMTVAAAMEEGKATMNSTFFCSGSRQIGRRAIRCAHGDRHGSQTTLDVIRNSCNVATAECAFRMGKKTLWEYERRFGLGERTGAGFMGESRGLLAAPERWSDMQLSNVAFGQGISVTPLQLAAAYGAIANDGVWMRPRIVMGTRATREGRLTPAPREQGRRVVSEQVARDMRTMLQAVVEDGTGKSAGMEDYTAGGKTGTAQIARNGSYHNGLYVASFVGIAPITDPQFVILVAVTAPKGAQYGGVVSAPVFKEIAEKALLGRRTPQDREPDPKHRRRGTPASHDA